MITPEQIQKFESSELAVKAVKFLVAALDNPMCDLTQTQYVVVRDYLLVLITVSNANRSGVLSTMCVKEYRSAKLVDGSYIISVDDHTTSSEYGPAKIIISPSLYKYIEIYYEKYRQRISPVSVDPGTLFLSWNGEKLSSGQITKCLQSAWGKAGLGHEITATLYRKSAVTAIHEKAPEMKSKLAVLMKLLLKVIILLREKKLLWLLLATWETLCDRAIIKK